MEVETDVKLKSRTSRFRTTASGRSNDRVPQQNCDFEEETIEGREEKKGLREKREEESGGNEISVLTAAERWVRKRVRVVGFDM